MNANNGSTKISLIKNNIMAHRIQRMQNMVDKVDGNDKKEIKAAKKEIRKGKKSTGASVRAQVQDEFGRDHGYHSDASKKLNASKLVQRKYAQERRQTDRSQPSAQKGAAKDWEGESKFGTFGDASETFTRKEGRQINRATNKENKKESRERTKGSKARAKVIRKSYRNK